MPYRVRKRLCTQSDGASGSYVLEKQNDDGSWEAASCHQTKAAAEAARRAREAAEDDELGEAITDGSTFVPSSAFRLTVGPFELGDNGEGAKTAPFRMVARSGQPIDHWWWGRVVHDLAGMQLSKDRVAIDYVHDDKEVIGYANRFQTEGGDLEVSGALTPYKDNDRASEIVHKASLGVPYEASINFSGEGIKVEVLGENQTAEVNGYKLDGPAHIIREWPLRGIAVCPYGADQNTSTEFSDGHEYEVQFIEGESQMAEAEKNENTTDAAENTSDRIEEFSGSGEGRPAVETATDRDRATEPAEDKTDGVDVAKLRSKDGVPVSDFIEAFGDEGARWFFEGKTFAECQAAQIEKLKAENDKLKQQLSARPPDGEIDDIGFGSGEESDKQAAGLASIVRMG